MIAMVTMLHSSLLENYICPVSRFSDSSNQAPIRDMYPLYVLFQFLHVKHKKWAGLSDPSNHTFIFYTTFL